MEKVGDGQEGEEAPNTSPPLELRRSGSVGMGFTGRASVPHSLHSPHDRATGRIILYTNLTAVPLFVEKYSVMLVYSLFSIIF